MKNGNINNQLTKLDDILGLETPSMHDGNETIVEYVDNMNAKKPFTGNPLLTKSLNKSLTKSSIDERPNSKDFNSETVPEMSEIDFQFGSADVNKLLLASYDAISKHDIPKYQEIQEKYKKGIEIDLNLKEDTLEKDSDSEIEATYTDIIEKRWNTIKEKTDFLEGKKKAEKTVKGLKNYT